MKDGIYFDLPEGDYHEIKRLSASGIKNLLISVPTFWARSWMNPRRKLRDGDTNARRLGRAYHVAVFEPHSLNDRFAGEPDYDAIEGLITTDTKVQQELSSRGEPMKKAGELALGRAQRLKSLGYDGPIKSIIAAEFMESARGKDIISAEYWEQLNYDVELIHSIPELSEFLTDGESEVTLLWTCRESGIKMKARIDKLAANRFVDMKSFENSADKPTKKAVIDKTKFLSYHISMRFYQKAIAEIGAQDLQIQSGGSPERAALINEIKAQSAPHEAILFFKEKSGVPNLLLKPIEFYRRPKGVDMQSAGASTEEFSLTETGLAMKADFQIKYGINQFQRAMMAYGEDAIWLSFEMFDPITDDDFSPYWLEEEIR